MITHIPIQVCIYNGSFDSQLKQNKHTHLHTKLHTWTLIIQTFIASITSWLPTHTVHTRNSHFQRQILSTNCSGRHWLPHLFSLLPSLHFSSSSFPLSRTWQVLTPRCPSNLSMRGCPGCTSSHQTQVAARCWAQQGASSLDFGFRGFYYFFHINYTSTL